MIKVVIDYCSKFKASLLNSTVLFLFCSIQLANGQEYFEFKNPSFSFSIPEGWKEYHDKPTLLLLGKYVKLNNGRIGAQLRVGRDIYSGPLGTIWNLNSDMERKELEKEAVLRNYSFHKETINGLKTIKINFETTVSNVEKSLEFKGVIYKFLVKETNKEQVLTFFLITYPRDFYDDNNDFLKIISSLNFTALKPIFNGQREYSFNNITYKISKPVEYDYFSNSMFNDMKINEFTKTYCFVDDYSIHDLELLIPKDFDNQPLIHFYTSNAAKDEKITPEIFSEFKTFWKEMYNEKNFEEILDYIISDSLLFCKNDISNTEPMKFIHLHDEPNLLSTLLFVKSKGKSNDVKKLFITNYIYLNETVIFIKLIKSYKTFSDIENIKNKSKLMLTEFLKNNKK